MGHELVLTSLRQGELTASDAWKLLAPLVKTEDRRLAHSLTEALRAWTWKALDRRRRDSGLREWIDVLNRVEGFFAERFEASAAKVELMAELLHESIAVAELAVPEDVLRRKHVATLLRAMVSRQCDWIDRGPLMEEVGLKPANMTRLMSLLVDIGWVEQRNEGRVVIYRVSAEGIAQTTMLEAETSAVTTAASDQGMANGYSIERADRLDATYLALTLHHHSSWHRERRYDTASDCVVFDYDDGLFIEEWEEDEVGNSNVLAPPPQRVLAGSWS